MPDANVPSNKRPRSSDSISVEESQSLNSVSVNSSPKANPVFFGSPNVANSICPSFDSESIIVTDDQLSQGSSQPKQKRKKHSVKSLQSSYVLTSRNTLKELDLKSEEMKKELIIALEEHRGKFSFTSDTWTSSQNLNYMSLTVQWIDKDWGFQSKRLTLRLFSESHTGKNIAEVFIDILQELNLYNKV